MQTKGQISTLFTLKDTMNNLHKNERIADINPIILTRWIQFLNWFIFVHWPNNFTKPWVGSNNFLIITCKLCEECQDEILICEIKLLILTISQWMGSPKYCPLMTVTLQAEIIMCVYLQYFVIIIGISPINSETDHL